MCCACKSVMGRICQFPCLSGAAAPQFLQGWCRLDVGRDLSAFKEIHERLQAVAFLPVFLVAVDMPAPARAFGAGSVARREFGCASSAVVSINVVEAELCAVQLRHDVWVIPVLIRELTWGELFARWSSLTEAQGRH